MSISFVNKTTSSLSEQYTYFLDELADPRTKDWFLLSGPLPVVCIILIYFSLIYILLPQFMKNRKPYDLKNVIFCYNIFQIMFCSYLVYNFVTPLKEPSYVWKCDRFNYSKSPKSFKQTTLFYYTYILKMIDMLETIFFVLRKKYNQVSTLHVYHHVSTLLMAWFYGRYFIGGMVVFCATLNTSVHVLMYMYYLCSSLGPSWQKTVGKWKSTLTMLQMIQFCILIAHASQVLYNPNCGLPKITFYLYVPNVVIIFYMFWKFYKKSYLQRTDKKIK